MVNGTAGNPEIENPAPDNVAAVIVTAAPVAVNVPVCDGLVVASGTEPKLRVVGERPRPAPTPLRDIEAGVVLDALLVNDSVPDTEPAANGEKLMLKF